MEIGNICDIVDGVVRDVCKDYDVKAKSRKLLPVSDFLLYNVTGFFKLNSFRMIKKVGGYNFAVGRNKFYELRDKFFWELDKKL